MRRRKLLVIICFLLIISISGGLLFLLRGDEEYNQAYVIESGELIPAPSDILLLANISSGKSSQGLLKLFTKITPTEKRIEVDITHQKLKLFENNKQIAEYKISSGVRSHPTPLGEFKIHNKFPMAFSQRYKCWLPFWLAFTADGLYGFHGLPICDSREIGKAVLGKPASHGCLRLDANEIRKLYQWTSIGTKIIISGQIDESKQDWCYNFEQNLWQGKRGDDIEALQAILNMPTDGIFDPITKTAVIKFQISQGLIGDGIVGSLTRAKLNGLYGCQ